MVIPQYEVQEYSYINKPRSLINKRAKRGSGGILLYINDKIGQNVELINSCISSEDRIWIKYRDSSSRDNDIYICFCYIPPKDSTVMCNEESQWSTFETEVVRFSIKGSILICGDMNARTGNMSDFIQKFPFILLSLMLLIRNSPVDPETHQLIHKV